MGARLHGVHGLCGCADASFGDHRMAQRNGGGEQGEVRIVGLRTAGVSRQGRADEFGAKCNGRSRLLQGCNIRHGDFPGPADSGAEIGRSGGPCTIRCVKGNDIGARHGERRHVLKEWREPSFEDFRERTAWSLLNAFTTVLGARLGSNPQQYAALTMKLQDHLDKEVFPEGVPTSVA